MTQHSPSDILVIDVGATSIKSTIVNASGERVQPIRKRKTPRPLGPEGLQEILLERVKRETPNRVVVGVPLECRKGVVWGSGNLTRSGLVTTATNQDLDQEWHNYPLEQEFASISGREVVVLNDAALAALGCVAGEGTELVVALGTGFGVALTRMGALLDIDDYGERPFKDGRFDSLLGEGARRADGSRWLANLVDALTQMVAEHEATQVWLVGGNAKRLGSADFFELSVQVAIAGTEAPFRGAATVFSNPLVIGR